ncbi:MAG: ATP-dependent DNA helicase RecG [Atopobiaceae bacterium]|nr:ATP-dependent DNA helicase RecG [Atopobiaceae bacterium]
MAHVPSIGEAAERVSRTCSLADDVGRLRYVSGAREKALDRLGITRVRDLLLHVPHRYLDFTNTVCIGAAQVGDEVTVVGTVDKVTLKRPKPRMQIVEMYVIDETGVVQASFFRQPWIADQVHAGDMVALSGKLTFAYGFKQMKAPFYEVLSASTEKGSYARVLPVHPVGEGITASWMRRIVSAALADVGDVCDYLPARLVARHRLLSLGRALRQVHYPTSMDCKEPARRRLAYDELLCLQLALLTRQRLSLAGVEPTVHATSGPHIDALVDAMPFALTYEQCVAVDQIFNDMGSPHVMNRLLLGDVGTGKTAVASMAMAAVADTGTQASMMAPTSVLARQYAEKLGPLLDKAGIAWVLITGSTSADERARAREGIAVGSITVVFGTTAILSDDIMFNRLTLVVIDEQHRFGVDQRAALRRKGAGADLLTMTATPIPRTLALSIYGDVNCSRITQRPVEGAGITTKSLAPVNLDVAWTAIREAVDAGHQAYVICPLVDDSDDGSELDDVPEASRSKSTQLNSAVRTYETLSGRTYPDLRVALLHGRQSAAEKDDVMARFRAGEIDVLVSTTVVEVGVDVPNATVMVVLDADRFGLATLHQLRGRVGRGRDAGTVYLSCAAKRGTPARTRLDALEATSDGFELADLDLKLRHEGEVLGYRQHGGTNLQVVDLVADADLIEAAHEDARELENDDPTLSQPVNRALALEVRDRYSAYFDEIEHA